MKHNMTIVDQKAATWLEDMCQKFEAKAMESMLEDSVKYVENHVQTMGARVEKLYSELVQNLLPVPPSDPVEPVNPGLRVVYCADNEICGKSELDTNREHVKVGSEKLSSDSHLAAELDDFIDDTMFSSARCNKDEAEVVSSQDLVPKATPIEGEGTVVSNLGSSSAEYKDDDCVCKAGEGKMCNLMDESHKINDCIPDTSTVLGPTIVYESAIEEDVLEMPTGMCTEPDRMKIEIDDADKEVLQLSEQQLGMMKLSESCVLVDKHQHFSVPCPEVNQSSYKKKIRDVFHLRRWSRSKNSEQINTREISDTGEISSWEIVENLHP